MTRPRTTAAGSGRPRPARTRSPTSASSTRLRRASASIPAADTCAASFPSCGGLRDRYVHRPWEAPSPPSGLSRSHRGPRPSAAAGARALPGRAAQGGSAMTPARRIDGGGSTSSTELWRDDAPLRIGISSCLLGEEVRWDGGHKRDRFLTDILAPYVEWVPVCPEVEVGMGTPREPVRLVRRDGEIVMLGTKSGRDWTAPMRALVGEARSRSYPPRPLRLRAQEGFAELRHGAGQGPKREGHAEEGGSGTLCGGADAAPTALPVEEEGRLNDAALRENFIERVFAYRRLRSSSSSAGASGGWSPSTPRTSSSCWRTRQGLPRARPSGGIREGGSAGRTPGAIPERVHGRARSARHAEATRERAAALHRPLPQAARGRGAGRAGSPDRGLSGRAGAARGSRHHDRSPRAAPAASSTSQARSISIPIRRS